MKELLNGVRRPMHRNWYQNCKGQGQETFPEKKNLSNAEICLQCFGPTPQGDCSESISATSPLYFWTTGIVVFAKRHVLVFL